MSRKIVENLISNHTCTNPPLIIEPYIYYQNGHRRAKLPSLKEAIDILKNVSAILNLEVLVEHLERSDSDLFFLLEYIDKIRYSRLNDDEQKELIRKIIDRLIDIINSLDLLFVITQLLLFVPISKSVLDACWEKQSPPSC